MNVVCPKCHALYRIDPERVPAAGARVRCSRCADVFLLTRQGAAPVASPVGVAAPATRTPPPPAVGGQAQPAAARATTEPPRPRRAAFAAQDPDARAQRIARALVSDIVAYHPERREKSLAAGTLRGEFREEIVKSWEEYVAQVGPELAKKTPHFRNALNEILARGQSLF